MRNTDVLIAGAGPVGLALGAALRHDLVRVLTAVRSSALPRLWSN